MDSVFLYHALAFEEIFSVFLRVYWNATYPCSRKSSFYHRLNEADVLDTFDLVVNSVNQDAFLIASVSRSRSHKDQVLVSR